MKAVQLDPNLPIAHAHLAHVLTFEGQHEQSIAEFERAFALNPNFTDWRFGMTLVRAGDPARAIQVVETQMATIRSTAPSVPLTLGIARYYLKEYSEALPLLREFASRVPTRAKATSGWPPIRAIGRLDEAHAEAAEALRIDPKFTIDGTARRLALNNRPEEAEHLFDGLRKAGLPEK